MTNATGRVLEVGRITTTSGDDTDTYENAIVVTFADRDELYRALKSKQCGLEWLSDEEWALLAEREKEAKLARPCESCPMRLSKQTSALVNGRGD